MSEMHTIVVDVETSGMSAGKGGRVIEVGAVVLEGGSVVAEFDTLINTGASIQYGAYRVHGISEEVLCGKPLPEDVWSSFREFVSDAELVAHNAPFDSSFIRYECGLLNVDLQNRWHCTVRLARQKLPQLHNHKLDTVYRYFFGSIPASMHRHRALDDARMAARIWVALKENY
jgi:DNA polymerase-3 subunit epsilon